MGGACVLTLLALAVTWHSVAATGPPMGWNSWDSYGSSLNETTFKANAMAMHKLLQPYGWNYVVIDAGWYTNLTDNTFHTDGMSRVIPDPVRYPSSINGAGFKPLVDWTHSLGLKFGIHVMRGISSFAVDANEPIVGGNNASASDVAVESDACVWWSEWYGLDATKAASQLYYKSVFELYSSWGVDFVKVDCIYGTRDEQYWDITAIAGVLQDVTQPMFLSLSPGVNSTYPMAGAIHQYANAYRVTNDLWDCWSSNTTWNPHCANEAGGPVNVVGQMQVMPYFAPLIGASGLRGNMLPLGLLGGVPCNLTQDEQVTVMTMWCMWRNPLIFGGSLANLDAWTLQLLTAPEVLAVNQNSSDNAQVYSTGGVVAWSATGGGGLYVSMTNINNGPSNATISAVQLGLPPATPFAVRDLWLRRGLGTYPGAYTALLRPHQSVLLLLTT